MAEEVCKVPVFPRVLREVVTPGVIAGWVAGAVMLLVAMLHAALAGRGVLWPLEMIATTLLSEMARGGGIGAVFVGLIIHFFVAGTWGVFFAALIPRGIPRTWAVPLALLFGLLVFLVMTWLVLPWAAPEVFYSVNPGLLLVYHLIYGSTLPLALPIRRTLTSQERVTV